MKQRKGFRFFAVFMLVLTLLAFALPAGLVSAAGVMTLSPNYGLGGTSVTITVTGLEDPYRGVELYTYFDSTAANLATSSAFGVYTTTYTIPSGAATGTHTFRLQTASTYSLGTTLASANFTVGTSGGGAGTLTVNPTSGAASSSATVYVSGLTAYASSTLNLFFGSTWVAYVPLDAGGSSATAFTVPPTATSGAYTLTLQTTTTYGGGATAASTSFTVGSGGTTTQSLTLSSSSGLPGSAITVSGTLVDYPEWELHLFFDQSYRSSLIVATNGAYSATVVIPTSASAGAHTITLQTVASYGSGDTLASGTYTVSGVTQATLTLMPTGAKIGDTITVSGTGFTAYGGLTFTFDNASLTTLSVAAPDSGGTFSTTFKVPTAAAGGHTVTVVGTGGKIGTATLTIQPSASLNPTNGESGDTVSVTGSGFTADQSIGVSFDGVAVSAAATVQSDGSFTLNFVVPPNTGSGAHTVVVSDDISTPVTLSFTTAASITLSSVNASVGDQLTVSGTGFTGGQAVKITLNGIDVTSATVGSAGTFSASFNVFQLSLGSYKVEARNATTNDVIASADVTLNSSFNLSAVTGAIGANVTVSGQGFTGEVQVAYDGVQVTTATVSGGAFSAVFAVPVSTAGEHTILVTDGTNSMQKTFTVESTPPAIPAKVYPEPEGKAKKTADFDWADVSDASGVTYNLQVATDPDFNNIVLEKVNLPDSAYQLLDEEKLTASDKDTAYYWRVQAVDAASNASDWSDAETFTVGGFQVGPIGTWVGVGVGMVLMLLLGFWFGRRTAYY